MTRQNNQKISRFQATTATAVSPPSAPESGDLPTVGNGPNPPHAQECGLLTFLPYNRRSYHQPVHYNVLHVHFVPEHPED